MIRRNRNAHPGKYPLLIVREVLEPRDIIGHSSGGRESEDVEETGVGGREGVEEKGGEEEREVGRWWSSERVRAVGRGR